MIAEFIALFACGTFFGAAIYITLAQHPAMLEAEVGDRFFPPMYRRAAAMQVGCALLGFIAGIIAAYQNAEWLWLVGSLSLIAVVPITYGVIKPINDILLSPNQHTDPRQIEALLQRWGPRHALRTIVSGIGFALFLYIALAR